MSNDGCNFELLGTKGNNDAAENHGERKVAPAFEDIIDSIGSRGKFQTRITVVFVCFAQCVNLLSVAVLYLAMQTPDHWCHVPGREHTNLTLQEWKNITIPREGDTFSKCLMYKLTESDDSSTSRGVSKCLYGWDYDDTWFSLTAASQMNWVCDNQHMVSDVFFYSQNIGVALGLLYGYLGDMLGRRLLMLVCLLSHAASRLLMVLTPHVPLLFILAISLVAGAAGPTLEAALSVGLELTDRRHRTTINLYAHCSFATGTALAGLLAWALPNWNYFVSSVPICCLPLFILFRWFPESPRWLACKGKKHRALAVLHRIATSNGSAVPPFAKQVIHILANSKSDRIGFLSLFSSWNVFKNTVLLIINRSVYLLTMYSPVIAASHLSVNPFLTDVCQGAAEMVAFFTANHCAARFGRRWPAVAAPLLSTISCLVVFFMLSVDASRSALVAVFLVMQLGGNANQSITNLQSIELHPTCLRQIAVAVEWTVAGITLSTLPYLMLMSDKRLPFAILAGLNSLAALGASFLPESAMQRLPETLADAAAFGRGQPYWACGLAPPPQQPPQ